MFDIYLYPFRYENNQEISEVPGFVIATAPKKPARNRIEDILLIYFANADPVKKQGITLLEDILPKAKDLFFKTSGPITTASKKIAEFINDQILQYNLKPGNQQKLIGALQILVMHKNQIYILHAGESSTFFLTRNHSTLFHDRTVGGQGIGLSRGIRYKFHHQTIDTGDRIVLVSNSPKKWTIDQMTSGTRLSISHLRRLLINNADQNFETIVMQFRPGDSSVHFLKLSQSTDQTEKYEPVPASNQLSDSSNQNKKIIADRNENIIPQVQKETKQQEDNRIDKSELVNSSDTWTTEQLKKPYQQITQNKSEFKEQQNKIAIPQNPEPDHIIEEKQPDSQPVEFQTKERPNNFFIGQSKRNLEENPIEKRRRPKKSITQDQLVAQVLKFRGMIQKFSTGINDGFQKIGHGITSFYVKATPQEMNGKPSLSMTGMFFTALIIPILVVAIAMTVYFQGKSKIHQEKIFESRDQLSLAVNSEDVNTKISYLNLAMETLDEAATYGDSEALHDLKNIVQNQLDDQLGITRLNVKQTIAGGLDRRIFITKLVSSLAGDIYALDSSTGRVLRLVSSKPDFIVDNTFTCGPGKHGELIVGNLVDIEPVITQNSEEIVIIGIDNNGSLLLCSTKGTPIAIKLSEPELGWGNIRSIAFDGYQLLILDTGELTRDIYSIKSDAMSFIESPQSLFGQNIPADLQGILDITMYQEDLYLLQGDGSLARCLVGNSLIETNCDLNIGYGRIRNDQTREVVSVMEGTQFSQLFITQPPDPSLYILDSANSTVFHFSLALNMQKQISPNLSEILFPPEGPLSAVTVNTSGQIHFAYGNDLFFGDMP